MNERRRRKSSSPNDGLVKATSVWTRTSLHMPSTKRRREKRERTKMMTDMGSARKAVPWEAIMRLLRRSLVCISIPCPYFICSLKCYRGVPDEPTNDGGSHGELCRYGGVITLLDCTRCIISALCYFHILFLHTTRNHGEVCLSETTCSPRCWFTFITSCCSSTCSAANSLWRVVVFAIPCPLMPV